MGIYYGSDYYGVKFINENNEELYKVVYDTPMKKEDIEYVKNKCEELKLRGEKFYISVNVYCTTTYDFPSTTELVWSVIRESELKLFSS